MGAYAAAKLDKASPLVPCVADAKSYTLYRRGKRGLVYVNFCAGGRQIRVSTGLSDEAAAQALITSYRSVPFPERPENAVSAKHMYRMIERCRYRNRKKGIPFTLGIEDIRQLFKRCRGYCEVTGHALTDEGPFRPSLDRIDPALGYTLGNVRIVCLVMNTAMLHYGETAFAEIAIAYCRKLDLIPVPSVPSS